jgi:aminoglycoside 3-N-acetyltransferase
MTQRIPHTLSRLTNDLRALGVQPDQIVMLHSSVKAVGEVMGGANTIIQALLDALGADGTLMMYAGWQDIPDYLDELPTEVHPTYYAEHPAFDPAIARAVRENSILAEFLRTWKGAHRSLNAEASMVAVGAQAEWITADHPIHYGYGSGSPLAKLVERNGSVLLLGSPLSRVTLLHYAEYCAKMRHKNTIRYQYPVLQNGQKVWIDVEDFETGEPHDKYGFKQIVTDYLQLDRARRGRVGDAESILFDAADLTQFAIQWLEQRFG